jgi:hypothetical protein
VREGGEREGERRGGERERRGGRERGGEGGRERERGGLPRFCNCATGMALQEVLLLLPTLL